MNFSQKLDLRARELGGALKRKLLWPEVLEIAEKLHEEVLGESLKAQKQKKSAVLTDTEWIDSLKREPAFSGMDVVREWDRCCAWYRQNVSKVGAPTRRRFTNWLLKAEKVMTLKSQGATHATGLKLPPPAGPTGWLQWLTTELSLISSEHPAHGQLLYALNARQFSALPASWQVRCQAWATTSHLTELPKEEEHSTRLRNA